MIIEPRPARLCQDFTDSYGVTHKAGDKVDVAWISGAYHLVMGFKSYCKIPMDSFDILPRYIPRGLEKDTSGIEVYSQEFIAGMALHDTRFVLERDYKARVTELQTDLSVQHGRNDFLGRENDALKAMIDKMKRCDNCRHYRSSCSENMPCSECREQPGYKCWELREEYP